jgi:hypothetical protein
MFHYIDFQARRLWVNLGRGGEPKTTGLGAVLCRNFAGDGQRARAHQGSSQRSASRGGWRLVKDISLVIQGERNRAFTARKSECQSADIARKRRSTARLRDRRASFSCDGSEQSGSGTQAHGQI